MSGKMKRRAVANPERFLIIGLVDRAVRDARASNKTTPKCHRRSALDFIAGEDFRDFCEWLGVTNGAINELVGEVGKLEVR